MNNIFYHFTSNLHIDSCRNEGLKLGVIPFLKNGHLRMIKNYQWLTTSPTFNQAWCAGSTLPYDRTEYRLKIHVPKLRKSNLFKWLDNCEDNQMAIDLNYMGDPENWFIYHGIIAPQWIKECTWKHEASNKRFLSEYEKNNLILKVNK